MTIIVRDMKFDLENWLLKDWCFNNPFFTAFFNAISLSFPEGEKAFIASVRAYRNEIKDKRLLKDIDLFCKQEAMHIREHKKYNKLLCDLRGYDQEKLEKKYQGLFANEDKLGKLATTVGMEHLTALLGVQVAYTNNLIKDKTNPVAKLWEWHAKEEVEHKSVAFDVYNQVSGDSKFRQTMMVKKSLGLFSTAFFIALRMLKHDKQLWKWNTFKSILAFFFHRNGLVRGNFRRYNMFFKQNFHPTLITETI